MSRLLVAVSVGPVQEFIAAARRTRDFWTGSTIVSESAKSVARLVHDRLGADALIFPAPVHRRDLDEIQFDEQNTQLASRFDVANVILFVAPDETDPVVFCGELKKEAQSQWSKTAERAAKRCAGELHDRWKTQLAISPIEFYAAWTPLEDDYAQSRRNVMRLLAGRKACRDFEPWPGEASVPKSSLDGSRETVLEAADHDTPRRRRRALRVKPNEELDLIGVVKRVDWGQNAIRYPSVSRVAIDPWIRGVRKVAETESRIDRLFESVRQQCAQMGLRERRYRNRKNVEDDFRKFPWLKTFPYEGVALYAARENDLLQELVENWDDASGDWDAAVDEAKKEIAALRDVVEQLRKMLHELRYHSLAGDPWPYLAILAADGDAMGRTLSELSKTADPVQNHQQFSRRQSDFARAARELINQKFSGVCVYASADDVLAFVAVDQCVECACDLRKLFDEEVAACARDLGAKNVPTLSVGLAIGHFMEPLEDLLDDARTAEKRAKEPSAAESSRGQKSRNAMAITIHARGGVPFTVRGNWYDGIDQRLREWADIHRQRLLPTKAAYDLRELAAEHTSTPVEAIRADALRVLTRKRAERVDDETRQKIRDLILQVRTSDDLRSVAEELLVGQWIGDAMSQAAGERSAPAGGDA